MSNRWQDTRVQSWWDRSREGAVRTEKGWDLWRTEGHGNANRHIEVSRNIGKVENPTKWRSQTVQGKKAKGQKHEPITFPNPYTRQSTNTTRVWASGSVHVPLLAALAKAKPTRRTQQANEKNKTNKKKTRQNQRQGHESCAGSSFGKVWGGDTEAEKEPGPEETNLHMTKWAHMGFCTQ